MSTSTDTGAIREQIRTSAERLAARLGPVRITARTSGPTLIEQEPAG